MSDVEEYVKSVAIDWVCPNNSRPQTEWEFSQVKYLTRFGVALLRNSVLTPHAPNKCCECGATENLDNTIYCITCDPRNY